MNKGAYKTIVKTAIKNQAFHNLQDECQKQSKTKDIRYTEFKVQDYLNKLYPSQSELVFRCRSKTLDIKSHRHFQYKDGACQWCNIGATVTKRK